MLNRRGMQKQMYVSLIDQAETGDAKSITSEMYIVGCIMDW